MLLFGSASRSYFDGVFGRGETYSFLPSKLFSAKDFRFAVTLRSCPPRRVAAASMPAARSTRPTLAFASQVIIENSREVNYFPEIIMDAIFAGAVPVYWGSPNIGDFFDIQGIIP